MGSDTKEIEQLGINTARILSVDAVQKANSGHPGMPMGAAPMAHVLWAHYMHYNPKNPDWQIVTGLSYQQVMAVCFSTVTCT